MKKNILIIGITGFLGRNLAENIDKDKYNVYGTYNSDYRYILFSKIHTDIICKKISLSSSDLQQDFENLLFSWKIDYVIHTAAMKYVNICEFDIVDAVKINILATDHIINACKRANIKNLIVLSTDKTILPSTIYGYTKLIMEHLVLKEGYSVVQGVNFLGSDGSVLDCWHKQYGKKKPLTVYDPTNARYFNTVEYVCNLILENIDELNKTVIPKKVYKISVQQLLDSFCKYFDYNSYNILGKIYNEKEVEDLNSETEIVEPDDEQVLGLIKGFFENTYNN